MAEQEITSRAISIDSSASLGMTRTTWAVNLSILRFLALSRLFVGVYAGSIMGGIIRKGKGEIYKKGCKGEVEHRTPNVERSMIKWTGITALAARGGLGAMTATAPHRMCKKPPAAPGAKYSGSPHSRG